VSLSDGLKAFSLRFFSLSLFQTPHDGERILSLARDDESAPLETFDGVAIGGQGAYFVIVLRSPQNRVAAERISFKLVSVLDVRQQVVFRLGEFPQRLAAFLLVTAHLPGQEVQLRVSESRRVGDSPRQQTP